MGFSQRGADLAALEAAKEHIPGTSAVAKRASVMLEKVMSEDPHLAGLDVKAFDLTGDGQVDWREFVAGAMQQHEVAHTPTYLHVYIHACMHACIHTS